MSSIRTQLQAQLACFDDDAFIALANKGLLRRAHKDLEQQTATIIEELPDALVMAFGDFRIRLTAAGPAQAKCSCPAAGVCQHILAAAISLQKIESALPQPAVAHDDRVIKLHDALIGFSHQQLVQYAGKAGYQWAWQFVLDLDLETDVQISAEQHVAIRFNHPRMTFRYMGGELASLVADTAVPQMAKYHVAAVLAYQRAQGVEIAAPEPSKSKQAPLELGLEHSVPETLQANQYFSRERLRLSVRQLLEECIALGLSHISRGIYERYATLAVWAQGAEYYRLAMLLRRLADHVDLLLERAGSADEHRLFDEMTIAFALVKALDDAAIRGVEPKLLVGQARSRYETIGELNLLGLGASTWRSASGYVGLTMLFWSTTDQAFVACTDARPEGQKGFNPVARYKNPGPWTGLSSPLQSTGKRLVLRGAQLNTTGRLSSAESTSALVQGVGSNFAQQLKPVQNWSFLIQEQSALRRSLLAEPQPMKDWTVLMPTVFGKAQFDSARQLLRWPLFDDNNQQLDIELEYSEHTAHAINRIEQLTAAQLVAGTMLVARLRSAAGKVVGEPLSLVKAKYEADENPIDALYFDSAPVQSSTAKWLSKLSQIVAAKPTISAPPKQSAQLPRSLTALRDFLRRQAERGITGESTEQSLQQLIHHIAANNATGLSLFSRLEISKIAVQAAVLQINYLCLQYERLLDSTADFED